MTSEEYKALSVKEFTEAAKIMTAVIPASMRCAKTIIRFYWKNWKKSLLIPYWTVAAVPVRRSNYCTKNILKNISPAWI